MPLQRQLTPELMDDPALGPAEHRRALAGLARLNAISGSDAILWPVLKREAAGRRLRVLDVATGSGDIPVRLARRARRAGVTLELAGCDVSPLAVAAARERAAAAAGAAIHYFEHDIVRDLLPGDYDVVIASLVLHHLSDESAITLLRSMAAAAPVILVNDLSRSRVNLALVSVACRLLSRSPVVHFDGPASVRAALTIAEASILAAAAGLSGATVASRFPCRWLLHWKRPA